jgi:hypothetical protein
VQLLKLSTGVQTQVIGQTRRQPVVGAQRVSLPAGPVQRHHQLSDQPLPQRIGHNQLPQLADQLTVPPELQLQFQALLGRGQALLLQSNGCRLEYPATDARQCRAAPQAQRGPQQLDRLSRMPSCHHGLRLCDLALEHLHVKLAGLHPDPVAGAIGDDDLSRGPAAGQGTAQRRDRVLHLPLRR